MECRRIHDSHKQGHPQQISLRDEELITLHKKNAVSFLAVLSGVIWMTGTPADGDILLATGQSYRFGSQWPWVLQAIGDAEIILYYVSSPS